MANAADSIQAKIGAIGGIFGGAIITPILGFALAGYHSLADYLDCERKSAVLLAAVGAFIGLFAGRVYGTYIAKNKKDDNR